MVLAKRNPSGGRRMMRARLGPDPLNLSIITRSIAPILVPSVLRTGVPSTRSLAITCAGFLSRRVLNRLHNICLRDPAKRSCA